MCVKTGSNLSSSSFEPDSLTPNTHGQFRPPPPLAILLAKLASGRVYLHDCNVSKQHYYVIGLF
jgi:hypothetical protein